MNRPDRPVSWRRNPAGTQISGLILLVVLTVCAPYAAYGTGMYEEDGSGLFDDGPSILPDLLFPGLSGTGSDAQNGLDPSSGTLPNPLLSTELLELLKNALEDSSRNGDVGTPAPGPNGTVTGPVSPASPNQPVAPAVGAVPANPPKTTAPAAPAKSGSAPSDSAGTPGSASETVSSGSRSVPRASAPASSSAAVPSPTDAFSSTTAPTAAFRELRIRTGDEATVSLEGAGWIYLGEISGKSGIVFRKRDPGTEKADFSFFAKEPGNYKLGFQRQDLSSGALFRETVAVTVTDAAAAVSPAPGASANQNLPSTSSASAIRPPQTGTGSTGRAPSDGAQSSGPIVSAPAAPDADVRTRAADGTGAPETGSADPDRVRTAGTIGDTESSGPAAGTLPAIQALLASGRYADAVAALERFLEENPESPESEEALFRLAELYEKNTSVRDLKKSVSCYDRLLERYPFTPFRERAEARRTYLIRHFFEIR